MMILLQLISIIRRLIPLSSPPKPSEGGAFSPIRWMIFFIDLPPEWDDGDDEEMEEVHQCLANSLPISHIILLNNWKLFPVVFCSRLIRISALLINYYWLAFVHQHKRRLILWTLYIYLCSTIAGQLNYNKMPSQPFEAKVVVALELTGAAQGQDRLFINFFGKEQLNSTAARNSSLRKRNNRTCANFILISTDQGEGVRVREREREKWVFAKNFFKPSATWPDER